MPTVDLEALCREEKRRQRYIAMEHSGVCAECGAPITEHSPLEAFDDWDTTSLRFACANGHRFRALFTLTNVIAEAEEELKA